MILTKKQEKFARSVAEGREPLESYDLAGYSKKQKPATRSNNAYKLLQNTDIITRIDKIKKEINEKLNKDSAITVQTLLEELQFAAELAKQPIHGKNQNNYDLTNLIKVVSEKAKLLGLYAPTKVESKTEVILEDLLEALK